MSVQQLTKTSFTILAEALNNPKGLTFAPDGSLYVVEAGVGGDGASIPAPSKQGNLSYGLSGAICKIENGTAKRVLSGLSSVAFRDGTGAAGPHDIKFDAAGKAYILLGLAANPVLRKSLGDTYLGKIITCDLSKSTLSSIVDISNYKVTNNDNKLVVVDAGTNSLFSVNTDGSDLKLVAAIPDRILTNPIFPGAKSQNFDRGHVPPPRAYPQAPPSGLSIQSVPTDVIKGADGVYYVCEFTGFPFPEGGAKIYRIDASGKLEVFADGFTQLIDMAFDADGNLYVLQHMNQSGWKGKPDGALIKITPNGERKTLIEGDGLESPSAFTIGPDGAFYIINRGGNPGSGQIVRVEP